LKHPKETPPDSAAPFHDADLLRLELLVAKRADRLWRRSGCTGGKDLLHWLQAEREVLGRHFPASRPKPLELAGAK
jgi:hypothetical protein